MKRLFAIGLTFAVLSASVNLEAMSLGIRMAMCGKAVELGLEPEPERDPVADAVGRLDWCSQLEAMQNGLFKRMWCMVGNLRCVAVRSVICRILG